MKAATFLVISLALASASPIATRLDSNQSSMKISERQLPSMEHIMALLADIFAQINPMPTTTTTTPAPAIRQSALAQIAQLMEQSAVQLISNLDKIIQILLGDQIETTTSIPSTTADPNPTTDATTENPDTTTENPDTTTVNPDTTTENPDTTTENPDTTTVNPDTTTDPSTSSDYPDYGETTEPDTAPTTAPPVATTKKPCGNGLFSSIICNIADILL